MHRLMCTFVATTKKKKKIPDPNLDTACPAGILCNKREFRDALRLRYDWPIPNIPSICVCGSMFTVDHAMICQRGGLVI